MISPFRLSRYHTKIIQINLFSDDNEEYIIGLQAKIDYNELKEFGVEKDKMISDIIMSEVISCEKKIELLQMIYTYQKNDTHSDSNIDSLLKELYDNCEYVPLFSHNYQECEKRFYNK